MSQSFLSVACAGLLLAAGALAAGESADVSGAEAPTPPVPGARVARTASVTVFVTVRDAKGKVVARPSASVEPASSDQAQAVGPGGVKLAISTTAPTDVLVLIPTTKCKVTLAPKMAGRNVMIAVDRLDSGTQCSVSEIEASGGAASAASATTSSTRGPGKDRRADSLLDAVF
jgi:hypothetical protein